MDLGEWKPEAWAWSVNYRELAITEQADADDRNPPSC